MEKTAGWALFSLAADGDVPFTWQQEATVSHRRLELRAQRVMAVLGATSAF